MSESDSITSSAAADCNRLDVLVEEAEHVQSKERFSPRPDDHMKRPGAYKRHIRKAISTGDWVKASSCDSAYPNWGCIPLTKDGDTALFIAVSLEQTSFVEKLVKRMSMQDMEILNAYGNTAFCMAAISGNEGIATILLNKSPRLAWIRGHKDMLPIQLAFSTAQPHMAKFLLSKTQKDMHINLSFQEIVWLFFLALIYSIYTVASELLKTYPKLVTTENEEGLTALEALAQLSFDKDALCYRDILRLLFKHMEEDEEFLDSERTSKAMFDAAKSGNIMILEFILKYNPNLLMKMNSKGQSLLHITILYRQLTMYRLILSKGAYKNAIMQEVDSEGNNVLHLVGKLPAEAIRSASPINHVLIRNEERWFEAMERIVPPTFKTMQNKEGLTPQELFLREHAELSEKAASDIHEMTNTFLIVATLIVSLGITGALTIRTNNIQGKTIHFQQVTWYIIFLLSVAVGIALSAVSTLCFTSAILRSVLKQTGVGHVNSRLLRVIFGCWLLFISIAVMVTFSTTSGAVLVYNSFPKWVLYTIAALGGIGVLLFYLIYDGFSSALRL